MRKIKGAALLIMTMIVMMAAGLMLVFASGYNILQQRTIVNQQDDTRAFAAAESGLDYTIAYLNTNSGAIQSTAVSGSLNYSVGPTTQADNSTYSAVITNPTNNDYTVLQITATGTSPDGTSSHVIKQQVYQTGSSVNDAAVIQGNVSMGGNSSITGTNGVDAGGAVTQAGSSSASTVNQNDSTLASMAPETLFTSIFGGNYAEIQASSTYYGSSASVPWGSLTGRVWVDSAVSLSGNTTIGSAANPVALIVNGDFSVVGNVTVYGLIYVRGNVDTSGSFFANGGVIAEGTMTMGGHSSIDYSASVLKALGSAINGGDYSKLPASWRDF